MFQPEQYQLVDFGRGKRLEKFANVLISRDTPAVEKNVKFLTKLSANSPPQLTYLRQAGAGQWQGEMPDPWGIWHRSKFFALKTTPAGQVGLFPEQSINWEWLEQLDLDFSNLKALNLFAYTGGTTMALATRGASVVHVDAAKNVVQWARRNVVQSGLSQANIRWICEDALKFVKREIKRGSKYDIIVADPPSYGKGPKNELWKFHQHFDLLLSSLNQIFSEQAKVLLISCHTADYGEKDLGMQIDRHFRLSAGEVHTNPLDLLDLTGRSLNCGVCLRYLAH